MRHDEPVRNESSRHADEDVSPARDVGEGVRQDAASSQGKKHKSTDTPRLCQRQALRIQGKDEFAESWRRSVARREQKDRRDYGKAEWEWSAASGRDTSV